MTSVIETLKQLSRLHECFFVMECEQEQCVAGSPDACVMCRTRWELDAALASLTEIATHIAAMLDYTEGDTEGVRDPILHHGEAALAALGEKP